MTGAAFVSTHLESHNSPFSARSDVAHGTTLRKARAHQNRYVNLLADVTAQRRASYCVYFAVN